MTHGLIFETLFSPNHNTCVTFILIVAILNFSQISQRSALQCAAKHGHQSCAELLLEYGAAIDYQDKVVGVYHNRTSHFSEGLFRLAILL